MYRTKLLKILSALQRGTIIVIVPMKFETRTKHLLSPRNVTTLSECLLQLIRSHCLFSISDEAKEGCKGSASLQTIERETASYPWDVAIGLEKIRSDTFERFENSVALRSPEDDTVVASLGCLCNQRPPPPPRESLCLRVG